MEEFFGAHPSQHGRAARAIHQRNPVKEKGRRKRTQQKILHRRFAGLQRVPAVSGQNVAGDRTHFESDERG